MLLTNIKTYILGLCYPEKSVGEYKSLHDYYEDWTHNTYVNGKLFVNDDPINSFQLSFNDGLRYRIDENNNHYIIETYKEYSELTGRMNWFKDYVRITVNRQEVTTDEGTLYRWDFGDLNNNKSLLLKVDSFTEDNQLYKGFSKEYIKKFTE